MRLEHTGTHSPAARPLGLGSVLAVGGGRWPQETCANSSAKVFEWPVCVPYRIVMRASPSSGVRFGAALRFAAA
jgi:hypothetical protein